MTLFLLLLLFPTLANNFPQLCGSGDEGELIKTTLHSRHPETHNHLDHEDQHDGKEDEDDGGDGDTESHVLPSSSLAIDNNPTRRSVERQTSSFASA